MASIGSDDAYELLQLSRRARWAFPTSAGPPLRPGAGEPWAGERPCAIFMLGARPELETLHYPASEAAARHGASAAKDTENPDEAYADWPGDYVPVRLPWPPES